VFRYGSSRLEESFAKSATCRSVANKRFFFVLAASLHKPLLLRGHVARKGQLAYAVADAAHTTVERRCQSRKGINEEQAIASSTNPSSFCVETQGQSPSGVDWKSLRTELHRSTIFRGRGPSAAPCSAEGLCSANRTTSIKARPTHRALLLELLDMWRLSIRTGHDQSQGAGSFPSFVDIDDGEAHRDFPCAGAVSTRVNIPRQEREAYIVALRSLIPHNIPCRYTDSPRLCAAGLENHPLSA